METHTGTTSHLKGTRTNGDTQWDYISSKKVPEQMETHTGTTSHLNGTRANGDTHWDYILSKRYQSWVCDNSLTLRQATIRQRNTY